MAAPHEPMPNQFVILLSSPPRCSSAHSTVAAATFLCRQQPSHVVAVKPSSLCLGEPITAHPLPSSISLSPTARGVVEAQSTKLLCLSLLLSSTPSAPVSFSPVHKPRRRSPYTEPVLYSEPHAASNLFAIANAATACFSPQAQDGVGHNRRTQAALSHGLSFASVFRK